MKKIIIYNNYLSGDIHSIHKCDLKFDLLDNFNIYGDLLLNNFFLGWYLSLRGIYL